MTLGKILTVFSIFVCSASSEYQAMLTCAAPDGKHYQSNTTFTTSDCLLQCVCSHQGHIGCVPLCPDTRLKCPIGYKHEAMIQQAGSGDDGCFCKRIICIPFNNNVAVEKTDYCIESDNYHKPGEEFIRNCTKLCRCYKKGHVRCVPLCPYEKHCPFGATELQLEVPAQYTYGQCMCKTSVCNPRPIQVERKKYKCLINGRSYNRDEDFTSADCTGYCKCKEGGVVLCVSLCPLEGIKCQHNEKTIELSRKVPNSNCTCPTWRCLKRQDTQLFPKRQAISNATCTSESGNAFQIGQVFVENNCTLKCHCRDSGKITCQPLCDDNDCAAFEKHKIIQMPVHLPHGDYGQSNCSCPIKICEPIEDKCIVGEYTYKPGDDFISSDCSGYCKCYTGGSVVCANLCPPEHITCQPDEDKINSSWKIPDSKCICPISSCLKRRHQDTNTCTTQSGKVYQIGQVFSDQNCTLQCHCEDYGKKTCRPLCPNTGNRKLDCQPEMQETLHDIKQFPDAEGKRCSCQVKFCGIIYADKCIDGENTYKPGINFVTADCSGYCKCHPGGGVHCVNLCPREGIICQHNEEKIQSLRKIPNSNCTCPIWSCSKKRNQDKCIDGENTYKPGINFVTADCSGYCKCHPGGGVHCVRLCPREEIICQHNEEKILSLRKIPNSNCTCPTWSCSKKRNQDKCIDGKNTYKPGNKFVTADCSGYCKCHPGGALHCVSLCPPMGITCQYNEDKIQSLLKFPNSNCTCPTWSCSKKRNQDKCIVGENTYSPGDNFVSADCSNYCKCHPGGGVHCISLCPPEGIVCQYNEDKIQSLRKIPNSNCTCPTWSCSKKINQDKCIVGENTYSPGDDFVSADCSNYCKCHPGGGVHCINLCPPDGITCQQHEDSIQVMEKIPNSNCTCLTWTCEKKIQKIETCVVGEHTYNPGEDFVSADCSGYCKCHPGGGVFCVSLCPPEGITCQHNEDAIQLSRKIPHSNCTCPTWRCLKKRQQDLCVVDGHAYQPGETFISKDCSGYCKCLPEHGIVACEMLCPQKEIICPFDEVQLTLERIPNSNCKCPKAKCVKKKADDKCIDGKNTYKPGNDFVSADCSGYCKCHPGGGIHCVSLCPPVVLICQHNEDKIQSLRKIPNNNCTCPTWSCSKKINQDGNWTLWSNWTLCDASCGGGVRRRYRSCSASGMCVGPTTETEVCNLRPCTPLYDENPCGSIRMRATIGGLWPRCDDDGFFTPLQCNPITSHCWCVDKWGVEEQGSRLSSHIPQCKNKLILGDSP